MSESSRRRLIIFASAALVAVVIAGFLVPLLQRRMESGLAPLSEIEIGEKPGQVRFAPSSGEAKP